MSEEALKSSLLTASSAAKRVRRKVVQTTRHTNTPLHSSTLRPSRRNTTMRLLNHLFPIRSLPELMRDMEANNISRVIKHIEALKVHNELGKRFPNVPYDDRFSTKFENFATTWSLTFQLFSHFRSIQDKIKPSYSSNIGRQNEQILTLLIDAGNYYDAWKIYDETRIHMNAEQQRRIAVQLLSHSIPPRYTPMASKMWLRYVNIGEAIHQPTTNVVLFYLKSTQDENTFLQAFRLRTQLPYKLDESAYFYGLNILKKQGRIKEGRVALSELVEIIQLKINHLDLSQFDTTLYELISFFIRNEGEQKIITSLLQPAKEEKPEVTTQKVTTQKVTTQEVTTQEVTTETLVHMTAQEITLPEQETNEAHQGTKKEDNSTFLDELTSRSTPSRRQREVQPQDESPWQSFTKWFSSLREQPKPEPQQEQKQAFLFARVGGVIPVQRDFSVSSVPEKKPKRKK